MMPNIDPRRLKSMMEQMGIKSSEVEASKVVIYCSDKNIVISSPQVTKIEMQGNVQFQVEGDIEEKSTHEGEERDSAEAEPEISEEDVKLVQEKTGKSEEEAREALENSGGDIAKAILSLSGQ
ncbi:MAG: nascent polypeptide-associated complex protein [Candidatus Micrarchaeia archaeon]